MTAGIGVYFVLAICVLVIVIGLVLLTGGPDPIGILLIIVGLVVFSHVCSTNFGTKTEIKGAPDIVQYEYKRGESSISGKYEILETETGNASGYIIIRNKETDTARVIKENKLKDIGAE